MYLTRELALARVGSWATSLFSYSDPPIGFARSEQRLLDAALRGLTDEELTVELQVSLSAIKKTWRSIYSRVDTPAFPFFPRLPNPAKTATAAKASVIAFSTMSANIRKNFVPSL